MSSLQCMSVISCIVQLGHNKPANEGSKYFKLGHEFLTRILVVTCTYMHALVYIINSLYYIYK